MTPQQTVLAVLQSLMSRGRTTSEIIDHIKDAHGEQLHKRTVQRALEAIDSTASPFYLDRVREGRTPIYRVGVK